jgi:D-3-phosphoglycerate dehydrogenase / 2-oxoglutarate reductase
MKIRILEPDDFPAAAVARLEEIAEIEMGPPGPVPDPDVRAVFVRLARRLGPELSELYPNLRWIVSPTTGLDHIDGEHFAARGVEVISLRGRTEFLDRIHATAEMTIALALALYRDLPAADRAVREGEWNRYPHKGRELHGKTVLILGYGRIGRLVEPLYRAFGCRVLAHDCVEGRVPAELSCDFPAALAETDVLSVHLPLNDDTAGIVGAELLARLPSRAVVINTSRGEIVDQDFLIDALESGALSGAALDVLKGEPAPIGPELQGAMEQLGGRLLITPHIGGFTHESLDAVELFITEVFLEAAGHAP